MNTEYINGTTALSGQEITYELFYEEVEALLAVKERLGIDATEKALEVIMLLGQKVDMYKHWMRPDAVYLIEKPEFFAQSVGRTVMIVHHSVIDGLADSMRSIGIEVRVNPK